MTLLYSVYGDGSWATRLQIGLWVELNLPMLQPIEAVMYARVKRANVDMMAVLIENL